MKKKLLVLSVVAACLSLLIGSTLAYFTTSDIARNVITTGNIELELIEKDEEGNDFVNPTGVTPGAQIAKIVTVKNTGDNECWVRISVEKAIKLAEGKEGTIDLSLVKLDLNTTDWTEKDGWFYYNEQLKSGETTEPLFTTVTFDTAMGNLYQSSTATVSVTIHAVQAANNGTTVFEAAGWPESK